MEAELPDAPHLKQAEIVNPQLFAPPVEYFEHQFYLVQIFGDYELPRTVKQFGQNWALVNSQRRRLSICSFNFRQELKWCSHAIMNRASSSAGLDMSVRGSIEWHRLSASGSRRCNPRNSCL